MTFHWREQDAEDFTEDATREQLRDYLAVLDLLDEFQADCLGWQYQLGLLPLRAASGLRRGLVQLDLPARVQRRHHRLRTEADQGNVVPMELMKRLLKEKGLHQAVMFHDVRWGAEHDGRFLWVLLNSRLVRRVRLQPRPRHAAGRPQLPPAGRATSRCPAARSPARACPAR